MANWLENLEEEKNKELNKNLFLAEMKSKDLASLKNSLEIFFQICNRVEKVKGILKIREFEVIGDNSVLKCITGENGFAYFKRLYRGIRFNLGSIEVFTAIGDIYGYDSQYYKNKFKEFVLFRNLTTDQSIINWDEENIINLIRWLLFDLDNELVINYIPGEKEYNYLTLKNKHFRELSEAISKLAQCERWQFGRDSHDKYTSVNILKGQIEDIKSKIKSIEEHLVNKKGV